MYNLIFFRQEELLARLQEVPQAPAEQIARICGAYEMAEDVHRYQKRPDGTPYFWHVTRVAKILIDELKLRDPDLICAALLHDALEDSDVLTPRILELNFGPYVAYLVQTLTKNYRVAESMREQVNAEYVMRIAQSTDDARVVKLADRLDNFRCLAFHLKRNPIRYINETITWYTPMVAKSSNDHLQYLMREIQKEQNRFLG